MRVQRISYNNYIVGVACLINTTGLRELHLHSWLCVYALVGRAFFFCGKQSVKPKHGCLNSLD